VMVIPPMLSVTGRSGARACFAEVDMSECP
jgi:hypothetical protein